MRKIAVLLLSLATAVCLGLAVACSGGGKSLSVGQSNYNAEYGDMFVIPEAVCKGLNPEDVTYKVTDAEGNEVFAASLGSFVPEIGVYTITYTCGEYTATATITCADTQGPTVIYDNFTDVVFEGETVTVPVFMATDLSLVDANTASLVIKKGVLDITEDIGDDVSFTAETGAEKYEFIYTVKDTRGNETVTTLTTQVKRIFTDADLAADEMWNFNVSGYENIIASPSAAGIKPAEFSIVTELDGVNGGALALKGKAGDLYGAKMLKGREINTEDVSSFVFRIRADKELSLFTIKAFREDIADYTKADLAADVWHEFSVDAFFLHPDAINLDWFEVNFLAQSDVTVYIDYVKVVYTYEPELGDGELATFDEQGYLANVQQAGYDIGKYKDAQFSIAGGNDLPEGARNGVDGTALKVGVKNVADSDWGGYGCLGDGLKYKLAEPLMSDDLGMLDIKIYCAKGTGLALAFNYESLDGTTIRSKARWIRGVEGQWINVKYDHDLLINRDNACVPKSAGEEMRNFKLTHIVISTCGNVDLGAGIYEGSPYPACTEFYVDYIKYYPAGGDSELETNYLADFDEALYSSKVVDATTVYPTDTLEVLPAGNAGVPAGAYGGVAHVALSPDNVDGTVYPNEGSRGAGIKFNLFEPLAFDDVTSKIDIRVLGVAGKGTYLNLAFQVQRNGSPVKTQALWQACEEGEWSVISCDKARLGLRLQAGDSITAIYLYACGDETRGGGSAALEFYIDYIAYDNYQLPEQELPAPVLPADTLIDWKDVNDLSRVGQSGVLTEFPSSAVGGAEWQILTPEMIGNSKEECRAMLMGYPYSGSAGEKWSNLKNGFEGDNLLEVKFRKSVGSAGVSYADGVRISLSQAFSFTGKTSMNLEFYSVNNNSGGFVIVVYDSTGNRYYHRVPDSAISAPYSWTEINIETSALSDKGLTDVKYVEMMSVNTTLDTNVTSVYACIKPITFTSAA